MKLLNAALSALAARRTALLVWAVLLLAVYGFTAYGRAAQTRAETALAASDPAVRDTQAAALVNSGRLTDVLAATQDPNQDAKSPRNVRSLTLRQNAAASVARLSAAHRLPAEAALSTLLLLRKDMDATVKATATAALTALGAENAANLKALVTRLSDGDPDIRAAAADALGGVGGAQTAALVDPLLRDAAAGAGAQAVMLKVGAPAVPLLVAHLSSPDAAFRQTVVGMLGSIAAPAAVPALDKVARADMAPTVRRVALVALAGTVISNYNTLAAARLAALSAPPDAKAQAAAASALSAFNQTKTAAPPLVNALRDPNADSQARTQAALALGRIASPEAAAALVSVLGDFDARVRQSALQGAQSVGAAAVPPLTSALQSGTPETRAAAAQALGGIATPAVVATLRLLLDSPSTPVAVRRGAIIGLGGSGSHAVLPLLVSALGDPDGAVQSAASDALLPPALAAPAVPLLVASFGKQTPVPFNASQTLARLGALPLPALKAALSSSSPVVQTWAAVTLGQSGVQDAGAAAQLSALSKSGNAGLRYAAAQALTQITGS